MSMTKRNIAIAAVKTLLESLQEQTVDVRFSETKYECCIDVRPRSLDCCGFWMGFSKYGTYGLSFGHGLAFEDLSAKDFPPDDVARAILDGNICETVWTLMGCTIKSVGKLTLPNGTILTDKMLTLFSVLGIGQKKQISYKPYTRRPTVEAR